MRRSEDFRRTLRRGRRASTGTLVVHELGAGHDDPALVGFVVSKTVGNAVVRHRVKRRLRSAVRPHLPRLDASLVVIRALPPAATADFSRLGLDLERCLAKIEGARA